MRVEISDPILRIITNVETGLYLIIMTHPVCQAILNGLLLLGIKQSL